jgi:hypothetical protein
MQKIVTLALLVLMATLAAACGDGAEPGAGTVADQGANLFQNWSFESGGDPWFSLATQVWGEPFSVSSQVAHSGESSAHLELRAVPNAVGAMIAGVVQETSPKEFPEVLSGYYYVDHWLKGTQKQYLQFVVIAFGATNLPGNYGNHQIRYPLAGVNEEPFAIDNAKFVFIGKEEPAKGQWVHFQRPIAQDFQELWGAVPQGFEKLRILFEVRYDDKRAGAEGKADVYYDDLYVGLAAGNPAQP